MIVSLGREISHNNNRHCRSFLLPSDHADFRRFIVFSAHPGIPVRVSKKINSLETLGLEWQTTSQQNLTNPNTPWAILSLAFWVFWFLIPQLWILLLLFFSVENAVLSRHVFNRAKVPNPSGWRICPNWPHFLSSSGVSRKRVCKSPTKWFVHSEWILQDEWVFCICCDALILQFVDFSRRNERSTLDIHFWSD